MNCGFLVVGDPLVAHPEPLSTTPITGQLLEWLH